MKTLTFTGVDNIFAGGCVTFYWKNDSSDTAEQTLTFVLNLKNSSGSVIATARSTPQIKRADTDRIALPTSISLSAGGLSKSTTYTVETTVSRNNSDFEVKARDCGLSISGMSISS